MSSHSSIDQFNSQFIRAGAGAGKTTQLIESFFSFVQFYKNKHSSYPRIVITTFTRKATQEVKERLLIKALSFDDQSLFEFINKKSSVHISTIHGLLSLLLSRHHDLLQLNAKIQVLDDSSLFKIYKKEVHQIIKDDELYLDLLEQFKFKEIVQLVSQFHQMNSFKKYTFVDQKILFSLRSEKIEQLKSDVHHILKFEEEIGAHKSWINYLSYLKSFQSILNKQPLNFQLIFESYENRPSKPRFMKDKPVFSTDVHDYIEKNFSSSADIFTETDTDEFIIKNHQINEIFFKLAKKFHESITDFKKETGQISISDLEYLSFELADKHPAAVEKFSEQFNYYMVDEYQDTSPLQVALLNILMKNKSQFIVGDPQQSIYLFRGAKSEVFSNKEEEAKKINFEMKQLNTNYRSEPRLMSCLNDIVVRLSNQFQPMIPKEQIDKQNLIQAYYIKTDDTKFALVQQIKALIQAGSSFADICILFTKNSDILEFSKYAHQFSVPVQPLISAGFDRKREIIDLISFLKFLVNPYDQLNLMTLLRSPWLTITDQEITDLRLNDRSNQNIWTQLINSHHADALFLKKMQSIYLNEGVISALNYFLKQTHFLIFSLYLDSTGLREANIYKLINDLKNKSKQIGFSLTAYLSSQFKSFHDDLGSQLNESVALFSSDRVLAMTIHASKGLQFKHVILSGIGSRPKQTNIKQIYFNENDNLFCLPIFNSLEVAKWSEWGLRQKKILNQAELSEYQRLFYVAVTRSEKSISFVFEQGRSVEKQSWFSSMIWPELGEHQINGYKHISLEFLESNQPESKPDESSNPDNKNIDFLNQKLSEVLNDKVDLSKKVENLSVTDLIQDNQISNTVANHSIDSNLLQNLEKAQKGIDLHRLFESLKYIENTEISSEKLNNSVHIQASIINWFFSLNEIPFRKILEKGSTEWGFGLMTSKGLIKGQIDLWSIVDSTIYIIDYKTGSSAFSDKAFKQLHVYAECLKSMKILKNNLEIKLVVLYPFELKLLAKEIEFAVLSEL